MLSSSRRVLFSCWFPRIMPSASQHTDVPFKSAETGRFLQEPPHLSDPWSCDQMLQLYLKRTITDKTVWQKCAQDFQRFGERIPREIQDLGLQCEKELPKVEHFDAWGKRIDRLITCPAWNRMKWISAEESLIAIGYDKSYKEFNRIAQYSKLYLYSPSAGLYTCPLAMTDGAAKVLKELNLTDRFPEVFRRLTSRDPTNFWTSGQWMTERKGGSDVAGGTETLAFPLSDGTYSLHGYKWFSSATDADVALTLARLSDENGKAIQGTKGLSLFLLNVRNTETGQLNGIQIVRLKDKLGTKQVPTAELLLDGTVAHKISGDGRGVASIAHMLNITRIHNALSAVGAMRRILNLARDYMKKRQAFGRSLVDWSLHMATLAQMETDTRGCFLFLMEISRLLGLQEAGLASEDQTHLLRLLTPILKLYTGKVVLPIWEGTTNVLSLDVLRHLAKEGDKVLFALNGDFKTKVEKCPDSLSEEKNILERSMSKLLHFASSHSDLLETAARDFAFSIAEVYIGSLMIEQASHQDASDLETTVSKRWVRHKQIDHIKPPEDYSQKSINDNRDMLLSKI